MANFTNKRPDIAPEAVAGLYQSGKTIHEIAAMYDCSTKTVWFRLHKAGQPLAPMGVTKRYPLKPKTVKNESTRRWRARNADRVKTMDYARYQVRRAIKKGILVRPDICENCRIPAKEKPQAAHQNYYLPLNVRWLCRHCHMIWDHDYPKTTRFRPILETPT